MSLDSAECNVTTHGKTAEYCFSYAEVVEQGNQVIDEQFYGELTIANIAETMTAHIICDGMDVVG
jgi:hypothetical protein